MNAWTFIYLRVTPVEPSLEFLDNDDAAQSRVQIRAQRLDAACYAYILAGLVASPRPHFRFSAIYFVKDIRMNNHTEIQSFRMLSSLHFQLKKLIIKSISIIAGYFLKRRKNLSLDFIIGRGCGNRINIPDRFQVHSGYGVYVNTVINGIISLRVLCEISRYRESLSVLIETAAIRVTSHEYERDAIVHNCAP